jgi:hypothetical protein
MYKGKVSKYQKWPTLEPSTKYGKDLMAHAVSRINIKQSTAINQTVAPKVLFTGM